MVICVNRDADLEAEKGSRDSRQLGIEVWRQQVNGFGDVNAIFAPSIRIVIIRCARVTPAGAN